MVGNESHTWAFLSSRASFKNKIFKNGNYKIMDKFLVLFIMFILITHITNIKFILKTSLL